MASFVSWIALQDACNQLVQNGESDWATIIAEVIAMASADVRAKVRRPIAPIPIRLPDVELVGGGRLAG